MSEDYGKRIKRAANLMSRSMDAYAAQYGLTGTQMSIIDFLGESQDHTQRDIEMEFDIRPSTTTKILQRMQTSGLVAAKRDPRDGRQRIIAPTAKARGLQKAVRDYIDSQQKAMDRRFNQRDLDAFDRVLAYFIALNSDDSTQAGKEPRP
ncbi:MULTISPECIES: MarR family winged helix-turn-helix transcriptional regulator [Bifidobacterium]|uniref:Winged helix-turn-helix transcriptional regulator n=1 Tax=Bifidobacterium asteroides TaxID=1684 RepID=A0A0F4M3I2_9BIFI|nr:MULTISPECIES: MarR family winged helix-turn-helix transcriptional regulator [Bifidobacterium]KJY65144.1 Transcriptional regulator, MarR family [Bifidobacterium asteroides]MBI0086389.1 winged helix-turn-helix transcriptional regulator [Bifidobacterium sp. M0404]TSJ86202.1 winged helix-turn-helix transcriptional regulator [Bifidobacterium polysaccharolyticum]